MAAIINWHFSFPLKLLRWKEATTIPELRRKSNKQIDYTWQYQVNQQAQMAFLKMENQTSVKLPIDFQYFKFKQVETLLFQALAISQDILEFLV